MRVRLTLFLSFLIILTGCSSTVSSIKEDVDINLEKGMGYLLIGVELNINLEAIEISGKRDIRLGSQDLRPGTSYFLIDMPSRQLLF